MKLSSKKVREIFTDMWPDLEYIWLFDRKDWLALPVVEIQKMLDSSKIPNMQWIEEFNDCDDFALQFLALQYLYYHQLLSIWRLTLFRHLRQQRFLLHF